MRASDVLTAPSEQRSPTTTRLAVAWQHPSSRLISPIGWLEWSGQTYRFRYVHAALSINGFRPLIGFPDLWGDYESDRLFPLFAQRVMSARRPDYARYLDRLDLDHEASTIEILGRSQGRRTGDTLQLFTVPTFDAEGATQYSFLVNGVRHVIMQDPEGEARLERLRVGDVLSLHDDPTNEANSRALITATTAGGRLGWVPDLLLDYVHLMRDHGGTHVHVEHINPPGTAPHMRLLVRLSGHAPPGSMAFAGTAWTPLAE